MRFYVLTILSVLVLGNAACRAQDTADAGGEAIPAAQSPSSSVTPAADVKPAAPSEADKDRLQRMEHFQDTMSDTHYSALVKDIAIKFPEQSGLDSEDVLVRYTATVLETFRGPEMSEVVYDYVREATSGGEMRAEPYIVNLCKADTGYWLYFPTFIYKANDEMKSLARETASKLPAPGGSSPICQ